MAVSTNGSAILLTSTSQSVTIPSGTTCVLFLWSYWNAANGNGLASATLNGVAPTSSGETTTADTGNAVGWAKFDAPSSGSQTFAYTLDATATEGPIRILVPLQGTTPTVRIAPTPVRNTSPGGTDALSISLTGLTVGDFCIMLDQKYGGTPPGTPSGWTSPAGFTQTVNSDSGRVSYISAAGTSVTADAQDVDFSSLVALALHEASTGIVGTASITEAGDSISSTGTVQIKGTLSVTGAGDTLSSTGTVAIKGTASVTEADDTVSSTSTLAIVGTLSVTEDGDTIVAAGAAAPIQGTASITEADDTVTATGTISIVGALSLTEDGDTTTAVGAVLLAAVASLTEEGDTLSAQGTLETNSRTGVLAVTEDDDSVASTATISLTGSLSITEADDIVTSTGTASGYLIDGNLTYQISAPYGSVSLYNNGSGRYFTIG